MMKKIVILLLVWIVLGGALSAQQKNALLDVVGKPFAEYHDTYKAVFSPLLHRDSLSRVELMRLFDEAAVADTSGEWKLLSLMVENTVRFYESRKGGYVWSPDYTAEMFSDKMVMLARQAEKQKFHPLKIFALYQAAEGYRTFVQNYERAFAHYLEIASELETISTSDFPLRPHIYNQIANMYYTFREYGEAIIYFQKVVEDPEVRDNYYSSHYPAMNGMGLSYRYGYDDYDRSDSCFRQILRETKSNEQDRVVWEGIAEGNIGYNYYLRGDMDTALLWLIPAIEKIIRPNDVAFVSQRAANVADIFLKKGKPQQAKKYIDIALDSYYKTRKPTKDSYLYNVLSRYYAYVGEKQTAATYIDSAMTAIKQENEVYSGLVLRRVEQRLRAADNKIHEQQLDAEQDRSRIYQRATILVSVAFIIILILLGLTLVIYRRQRKAYRELVRHSQDWAKVHPKKRKPHKKAKNKQPVSDDTLLETESDLCDTIIAPEEKDKLIMKDIDKIMSERKLFTQTDLTLDTLATQIGYNRYYISTAMNRCSKKNFNSYINEYRIKEAIQLISDPIYAEMNIEDIAFKSGFNDRRTFYRVFKNITGLSPGTFRKNTNNN